MAGLSAEGVTEISNIEHIDRGYEEIEQKLIGLGADIERIDENGKTRRLQLVTSGQRTAAGAGL